MKEKIWYGSEMKISIFWQFLIAILAEECVGRDELGKSGVFSRTHDSWCQTILNAQYGLKSCKYLHL